MEELTILGVILHIITQATTLFVQIAPIAVIAGAVLLLFKLLRSAISGFMGRRGY